jgi:hypothetical protein
MRYFLALSILVSLIPTVQADDQHLPPGTLQRGTLANAQLIADAKVGVASKVGTMGCSKLGDVDIYVTALPTGTPGNRRWKELWIVSGCNSKYPVNITFVEDGKDADWTIS